MDCSTFNKGFAIDLPGTLGVEKLDEEIHYNEDVLKREKTQPVPHSPEEGILLTRIAIGTA